MYLYAYLDRFIVFKCFLGGISKKNRTQEHYLQTRTGSLVRPGNCTDEKKVKNRPDIFQGLPRQYCTGFTIIQYVNTIAMHIITIIAM